MNIKNKKENKNIMVVNINKYLMENYCYYNSRCNKLKILNNLKKHKIRYKSKNIELFLINFLNITINYINFFINYYLKVYT